MAVITWHAGIMRFYAIFVILTVLVILTTRFFVSRARQRVHVPQRELEGRGGGGGGGILFYAIKEWHRAVAIKGRYRVLKKVRLTANKKRNNARLELGEIPRCVHTAENAGIV